MKAKISRVIVAVVVASTLLLAGTAHAGYGQPGPNSTTTTIGK